MEKEVLEVVLRKHVEESTPVVVTEIISEPVEERENFMSNIFRLKAKVILGNGTVQYKKFILKKEKPDVMGPFMSTLELFKAETKVYTVVLKEMEYLMDEFTDTDEPLWARLIHYEQYTSIMLEDLETLGYSRVDRQTGMNLDQGELAMRALGKYHGMMKVLESRGIVSKDDYRPYIGSDKKFLKTVIYPGVQNMVQGIKEHWGPDWNNVAEKLTMPLEEFCEKVLKSFNLAESDFTVQNHGNCWSNNIMFKYDWNKRPISVRFVDFQLPHYNTPCMDVSNLMYLSIQPAVRRENYSALLESYHESLISTLDKFKYNDTTRPSLEQISNFMERLSVFWIFVYAAWYPLLTHENSELMETFMKTEIVKNTSIFTDEGIKAKLGPDLINLTQKHIST